MGALSTKSAIADKAGRWQARPAASSGHDWHVPQAALLPGPLQLWLIRLDFWFSMKLCRLGKNPISISSSSLGWSRTVLMKDRRCSLESVTVLSINKHPLTWPASRASILAAVSASRVRNAALSALTHLPSKAGTWSYGMIEYSPRTDEACSRESRTLTSPITFLGYHPAVLRAHLQKHGTTELRVMSTCIDFTCTMTP